MADPSGYHPRMDGRYFISFYEDDVQDVTPDEGPLDEYELAALSLVWDQVEKESSRNVTDDIAEAEKVQDKVTSTEMPEP